MKQLSEVFVAEAPEERQVPEEFHCQGQKSQTAFVTDKVSTDEGGSREAAEMSPTLAAERNEQLSFCLSAAATAKLAPAAGVPPATGQAMQQRVLRFGKDFLLVCPMVECSLGGNDRRLFLRLSVFGVCFEQRRLVSAGESLSSSVGTQPCSVIPSIWGRGLADPL